MSGTIGDWESELRRGILPLEGGATGRDSIFGVSGRDSAPARVSAKVGEDCMGCWGRDQTLGVGVRRGGSSGLDIHSSSRDWLTWSESADNELGSGAAFSMGCKTF